MKRPYKITKGELKRRAWLRSMGIKPLPGPPRQPESLIGQRDMFEGLDEKPAPAENSAPEDSQ